MVNSIFFFIVPKIFKPETTSKKYFYQNIPHGFKAIYIPDGNINTELKYRIMCIGIPFFGEE